MKSGFTIEKLVKLICLDLKTVTKTDVCLVWGGSNDVGRNETNTGIRALHGSVT
jgi:hypothetical protein